MLDYYASHGPITDPGPEAAAFAGLPADLPSLTRIVQGLVFHYFADEHIFGWKPPKERMPEIDARAVPAMLARLTALDGRPLAEPRPPERRILGCCRDFTVLLGAMARHHRIPVRARVVQDLAALNKMELLLWDIWGLMQAEPDAALPLLDEVAERTQAADGFADVRRLYATPGLTVPPRVLCLSPARGPHEAVVPTPLA